MTRTKKQAPSKILGITPHQVGNLRKLAKGLRNLTPKGKKQFNMRYYLTNLSIRKAHFYSVHEKRLKEINLSRNKAKKSKGYEYSCGTVACALGFAPLILGEINKGEEELELSKEKIFSFVEYSERVLGVTPFGWDTYNGFLGSYFFDADWYFVTGYNTPEAVATRIELTLEFPQEVIKVVTSSGFTRTSEGLREAYRKITKLIREEI